MDELRELIQLISENDFLSLSSSAKVFACAFAAAVKLVKQARLPSVSLGN
mgnify:CR=1 FL=1